MFGHAFMTSASANVNDRNMTCNVFVAVTSPIAVVKGMG